MDCLGFSDLPAGLRQRVILTALPKSFLLLEPPSLMLSCMLVSKQMSSDYLKALSFWKPEVVVHAPRKIESAQERLLTHLKLARPMRLKILVLSEALHALPLPGHDILADVEEAIARNCDAWSTFFDNDVLNELEKTDQIATNVLDLTPISASAFEGCNTYQLRDILNSAQSQHIFFHTILPLQLLLQRLCYKYGAGGPIHLAGTVGETCRQFVMEVIVDGLECGVDVGWHGVWYSEN